MAIPRDSLSKLRREHVEEAFREIAAQGIVAGSGSYFVALDGHELPAKRVLRVAYRLATGTEISASAFSGGLFTAKVLEGLGLTVVVRGASPAERRTSKPKE